MFVRTLEHVVKTNGHMFEQPKPAQKKNVCAMCNVENIVCAIYKLFFGYKAECLYVACQAARAKPLSMLKMVQHRIN